MNMTNEEIVRNYREAKKKLNQIKILADMNECKSRDIAQLLIEAGESVPSIFLGQTRGKKIQRKPKDPEDTKPARESFELETTTEPAESTGLLTVADLIEVMKTLPQNVPILGDGFRLTTLKTLDMGTGKITETIFMEYPR